MTAFAPAELAAINRRVVERFGGAFRVLDPGLVASAAARPFATAYGHDLYPEPADKAAALFHSLIKNHPFAEGNKRTALVALIIFLEDAGLQLAAEPKAVENFTVAVADGTVRPEEIAGWLRERTVPTP